MDNKTLQNIPINDISPNPHNPRIFFDEEEMTSLRQSIVKVGILVPITVYRNEKNHPKENYIILDGERRWKCAQSTGMTTVPANVIDEPEDITQNILYMFNIHHFRTEWELVPTALKLDVLIKKLGSDNESELSEFTGLSRSLVRRCKILLWYSPKIREELLNRESKYSTDFLIELYPVVSKLSYEANFVKNISIEDFVERITEKYDLNKEFEIKDLRTIRRSFAYHYERNEIDIFIGKTLQFINTNAGIEIFESDDLENEKSRRTIIKNLISLNELVVKVNPEVVSDKEFIGQLSELFKNIKSLLDKIE